MTKGQRTMIALLGALGVMLAVNCAPVVPVEMSVTPDTHATPTPAYVPPSTAPPSWRDLEDARLREQARWLIQLTLIDDLPDR